MINLFYKAEIIMVIMSTAVSLSQMKLCDCHQCDSMLSPQARCECCTYFLTGKRSDTTSKTLPPPPRLPSSVINEDISMGDFDYSSIGFPEHHDEQLRKDEREMDYNNNIRSLVRNSGYPVPHNDELESFDEKRGIESTIIHDLGINFWRKLLSCKSYKEKYDLLTIFRFLYDTN